MNKKINYLLLLVFLSNLLFAQNQSTNLFLPEKFLSFQTLVPVNDIENEGLVKQIGQKNLNDIVFNQVLAGKVNAYDLNYASNNFPYDLSVTDTFSVSEIYQNLTSYQLDQKPDMTQIKYYNFVEEWIFDADAFTFEKKVLAYQPVREFEFNGDDNEGVRHKIVFAVLNPENINLSSSAPVMQVKNEFFFEIPDRDLQKSYLAKDIEVLCYNGIFPESKQTPYWNSFVRGKIVNSVFDRILSNSIPVFDLKNGSYIPFATVKKSAGIKFDTVMVDIDYNDQFTEKIIQREFNPMEIKSMFFVEDWFINPVNLNFTKNVVGIVPFRSYYKNDQDTLLTKKSIGMIYFNNENKERIDLIYKQLTSENDFLACVDGVELFTNMGNQSKNQIFKALCEEKQQSLLDYLYKQNLEKEQLWTLYILSEKINKPADFNIYLNVDDDKLKYFASSFLSMSDTAAKAVDKTLYLKNAKSCLERLNHKEMNCEDIKTLESINEILNDATDINKIIASNDKLYLNCFAEYYYLKYWKNKENKNDNNKEKAKKLYTKLKDIDNNAITLTKCLDLNILTKDQILQISDTTMLKDFFSSRNNIPFSTDSIKAEFNQMLYLGCQKFLEIKYNPEYVKLLFQLAFSSNIKFDYQYMLQSDSKDVLFDYYQFIVSTDSKLIADAQPVFNKIIKNADVDNLWWMMYYQMVYYRWYSDAGNIAKITFDNAQTCLDQLLKINFKPEYKIVQYEMDVIKNSAPEPIAYFETKNTNELNAYAEYFSGGYSEYYTPPIRWTNENQFLINNMEIGLKLYEKLISINPADSIRRKASAVCFNLEAYYLQSGYYAKAMDIAPKIQKIDPTDERGVSAMILAYLYNNQYAKAEQLAKKNKDKPSVAFGTMGLLIGIDVEAVNSSQPNEDCNKILTLLK